MESETPTEIDKLETQLYLNLLYAGSRAKDVDSAALNAKLTVTEGKLFGALIAMSQTVSLLMIAKGKK